MRDDSRKHPTRETAESPSWWRPRLFAGAGLAVVILGAVAVLVVGAWVVPTGTCACSPGYEPLTLETDQSNVSPGDVVTFTVVNRSGEPVEGATVIVRSGTLHLEEPYRAETTAAPGSDPLVAVQVGGPGDPGVAPVWGENQTAGTLQIEVDPPQRGRYSWRGYDEPTLTVERVENASGRTD